MHPETQEEIQQTLYFLNNRHRLKMQDMPKYLRAQELARKYGLEEIDGLWYQPSADIKIAIDQAC
jgi:hypothetical protein